MNTAYLIPIITAIFLVGITAFVVGYVAGLKVGVGGLVEIAKWARYLTRWDGPAMGLPSDHFLGLKRAVEAYDRSVVETDSRSEKK